MKKKYHSPRIVVNLLIMEESISTGSSNNSATLSVGPDNDLFTPSYEKEIDTVMVFTPDF